MSVTARLEEARGAAARRRTLLFVVLGTLLAGAVLLALCVGQTVYPPSTVWRVLTGEEIQGATYAIGRLRLPRTALAVLTGLAFGVGGATFQTMLRNPLASPDVLGINAGASAAAVVCITLLGLNETVTSIVAVLAALAVAATINLLAATPTGVAGTRFILIGIGMAALLNSVISYALSRAAEWDLQAAMRWLTGSLNSATWPTVLPVAVVTVLALPVLLGRERDLGLLRTGDDTAAALGVDVRRTRMVLVLGAVVLLAFATAATGPIAFVAFLSGPIAVRLRGSLGPSLLTSGLVGALLVLLADLAGQFAFGVRLPVGVITGVLGAPFLLYLLVRANRTGSTL